MIMVQQQHGIICPQKMISCKQYMFKRYSQESMGYN